MTWWMNDTTRFDSALIDRLLLDPATVAGYDLRENGGVATFSLDLPGAKSSDLTVVALPGRVKIKGMRKGKEFAYEYALNKNYDPSTGAAKMEDGVLTLTFNKYETLKDKAHVIQVK
jgi:HSP20 family molecular chaperone IbpA